MQRVQLIRDIAQNMAGFTGLLGEITATTDTFELRLHDQQTPGGYRFLPVTALDTRYQASNAFLSAFTALSGAQGFLALQLNGSLAVDTFVAGASNNIKITFGNGAGGSPTVELSQTLNFAGNSGATPPVPATVVTGGTFTGSTFVGDGKGITDLILELSNTPTAISSKENNKLYTNQVNGASFLLPDYTQVPANTKYTIFAANGSTTVNTSAGQTFAGTTLSTWRMPFLETITFMNLPGLGGWYALNGGDGHVGQIYMSGVSTDAKNAFVCDGRAISRTAYANLFAVIGTSFGAGDGATTFNIPNMQNHFPFGGTGMGVAAGATTVALGAGNIPSHTHSGTTANESTSHTHSGTTGTESQQHSHNITGTPGGGTGATSGGQTISDIGTFTSGTENQSHTHSFTTGTESNNHNHTFTTDGGAGLNGSAFSIMPPYLTVAFLIRY